MKTSSPRTTTLGRMHCEMKLRAGEEMTESSLRVPYDFVQSRIRGCENSRTHLAGADNALTQGDGRRFCSIRDLKFGADVVDVIAHGVMTNVKCSGNFLIGKPF